MTVFASHAAPGNITAQIMRKGGVAPGISLATNQHRPPAPQTNDRNMICRAWLAGHRESCMGP